MARDPRDRERCMPSSWYSTETEATRIFLKNNKRKIARKRRGW
jgi:hypothetical protein